MKKRYTQKVWVVTFPVRRGREVYPSIAVSQKKIAIAAAEDMHLEPWSELRTKGLNGVRATLTWEE